MREDQNNQFSNKASEESKVQASGWKKIFKRKWFFPAVYLAAAALILALITWYQNPNDFAIDQDQLEIDTVEEQDGVEGQPEEEASGVGTDEEAMPVTAEQEQMMWPATQDQVEVVMPYFDDEASEEDQMEAMVEYSSTYHPNTGICLAHSEGEAFDVLAAFSGTVTAADKDPLVGHYVEIEHENGLVTIYQSLEDLQVSEGDTVEQGDVLAQAGRNLFQKELGIHLHFEVRENGVAVNPAHYLAADSASE